ncbi:MAG: EAL domain-containing protein, partial [Desulfoplanes sp.]
MADSISNSIRQTLKQQAAFSHALFENTGGAFFILDRQSSIQMMNGEAASLTGYSPKELSLMTFRKIVPEDMAAIFSRHHDRLFETNVSSVHFEMSLVCRDGGCKEVRVTESRIPDSEQVVLAVWDVSDIKRIHDALKVQTASFHQLFSKSPLATVMFDATGKVLCVNTGFTDLFGYIAEDMEEKGFSILFPEVRQKSEQRFLHAVLSGKTIQMETKRKHRNESLIPVAATGYPLIVGGEILGGFFVYTDISERKVYEKELVHQALHDTLTQLPNRALFMERLEYFLMRHHRNPGAKCAILMIDLDRFKLINDSLGHLSGDALLVRIARRLEKCLRPMDTVARLGGDEFGIILAEYADKQDAALVAKRILKEVSRPMLIGTHKVYSGASIGIAFVSNEYTRPEDMLRDADLAMYRAKSLGKGRFKIFSQTMHDHAVTSLTLENDLRQGIIADEFFVVYQPIISLETGEIHGVEALARWDHPVQGMIPPARFIPIAEETGMIIPLGRYLLTAACSDMMHWLNTSPHTAPKRLSVNISPKQFAQSDFVDSVSRILEKTGLSPHYLKIEITETAIMENALDVIDKLKKLRNMGIQLSIDDFGTGYSSMSYLKKFPVDQLKIDLSFVRDMHDNQDNLEIVRAIVQLAHSLRL